MKNYKITIKHFLDDSTRLDYLGTYSDTYKENCIDRKELNHMLRGEYRYFHPAMTGEETGNPESPMQDYLRCESYNALSWNYIGVRAEIQIVVTGITQTLTSGGLWGIESDSDPQYMAEIEQMQVDELKTVLADLGISLTQLSDEITVERE